MRMITHGGARQKGREEVGSANLAVLEPRELKK